MFKLGEFVKCKDPEEEWLQSPASRNDFNRHARDAVLAVISRMVDGRLGTTWAKLGPTRQIQMIDKFKFLEPNLVWFANDWAAIKFLDRTMKNMNVTRKSAAGSMWLETEAGIFYQSL